MPLGEPGLHFNFLWRTCFRQVLGLLFIFSSELLFFSFYCKGKREKKGKPCPVTPLFAVPFFSSSTCRLVWVGATNRVVMVTFQVHLQRLLVSPCTFPTPIYCRWVNEAKSNLGSGLHHQSNMGWSSALTYFTALSL